MQDPNRFANVYNESNKNGNKRIRILDSTLREGEQHPGVSFTVKQRIQIAWMLDYFGVDQIEISPVISTDHEEATKAIIKAGLNADIVAHCRALKSDIDVALRCDAKWMAMYLGISDVHLASKLRISREQALERAVEAVDYMKAHGLKGRFTVEDASRTDPEYLKQICKAISDAGADRISIPDTVGIMRPRGMYNLVKMIKDTVDTPLDVHCHNDIGLALSNALAGVDAGADQIHTTIDGVGERTGIPSLAETALALTLLYNSRNDFRLDMLKDLSKLLGQYTNIHTPESKPLVGESAFKHKAGTHLAAVLRNPAAYEIIEPRTVGNRRKIVFGELAGKNGTAFLMSLLGLESKVNDAEKFAHGLKELRMGDVLEIFLDEKLEQRIISQESDKVNE
ncbi:MAG TPA: 2-isopropylmalate synthase [Nitrososphaerales archaeon]|nr:2-isopropylmalate synthase [Nitrososphaerales archaeon]